MQSHGGKKLQATISLETHDLAPLYGFILNQDIVSGWSLCMGLVFFFGSDQDELA